MRTQQPLIAIALVAPLLLGGTFAHAQGDASSTRAERKAEGREAARNFQPGEGNPIPDAKPRVPRTERRAARQARKPAGAEASKAFEPGEGNPIPEKTAKVPRSERKAANAARRAEIRAANKARQIPSYGEDYGTKK